MSKDLYIAGPLGFSEAGRFFLYGIFIPRIQDAGYGVIDPWKLTPESEMTPILKMPLGIRQKKALERKNFQIAQRNAQVIERAHGIVAMLDGTDVDSGTAGEVGFGYGLKKPILGYRNDFRLSGDNIGNRVNLQVEYFILDSPHGKIISSIEQLPRALRNVFGKPN